MTNTLILEELCKFPGDELGAVVGDYLFRQPLSCKDSLQEFYHRRSRYVVDTHDLWPFAVVVHKRYEKNVRCAERVRTDQRCPYLTSSKDEMENRLVVKVLGMSLLVCP